MLDLPLWTVQGQGKLRLFPGRFQPPPAWHGQSFAGLLLHLGWSSVGRGDCESSPKSLGLTKIGPKGDLSQPKLTWEGRMKMPRQDLLVIWIPLGILEWIDAVRSRGGWDLWRPKAKLCQRLAEGMDRVITGYKPPSPELFTETKDSVRTQFKDSLKNCALAIQRMLKSRMSYSGTLFLNPTMT